MAGNKQPDTVFISGGMSGLGRALATAYLGRGASVAIFDLAVNEAVVTDLQQHAADPLQSLQVFPCSVTDSVALSEAVATAVERLGAPELAINCAGIQRAQAFAELPGEHFEQVIQVNLIGSRNFAAAVLPTMQKGARLALVASMAGFAANYSYAAYCASKYAVVGLGRVLRLEYKPLGIDISLICPPEVATPMVEEEIRTMHPASRRLKNFGGTLTVEQALRGILAGLDAGRSVIIPGAKAKLTYFCSRYLPDALMNVVVDAVVRTELRKQPAPTRDVGKGAKC